MAVVLVQLLEGFDADTVVVKLDGVEVYRKSDVNTRMQISEADRVSLDTTPGSHLVEVLLPGRRQSNQIALDVPQQSFVWVFVEGGAIRLSAGSEPYPQA